MITLEQVLKAYEYADSHPHKYLRGTTNWCAAVAHSLNEHKPDHPCQVQLDGCDGSCVPAAQHQGHPVNRLSYSQGDRRYVNGWNDACSHWEEQPAPVAVVMPERDALRDLLAGAIGGDTYDCTRVWSAWGVGTMSEDDFVSVVEQDERLYEIADSLLAEVARLNGVKP